MSSRRGSFIKAMMDKIESSGRVNVHHKSSDGQNRVGWPGNCPS
ncbi:hypothetical protein [Bacillus sp. T33-2]|nr:hypothetical protein [Bacillus sp. T33-2]